MTKPYDVSGLDGEDYIQVAKKLLEQIDRDVSLLQEIPLIASSHGLSVVVAELSDLKRDFESLERLFIRYFVEKIAIGIQHVIRSLSIYREYKYMRKNNYTTVKLIEDFFILSDEYDKFIATVGEEDWLTQHAKVKTKQITNIVSQELKKPVGLSYTLLDVYHEFSQDLYEMQSGAMRKNAQCLFQHRLSAMKEEELLI